MYGTIVYTEKRTKIPSLKTWGFGVYSMNKAGGMRKIFITWANAANSFFRALPIAIHKQSRASHLRGNLNHEQNMHKCGTAYLGVRGQFLLWNVRTTVHYSLSFTAKRPNLASRFVYCLVPSFSILKVTAWDGILVLYIHLKKGSIHSPFYWRI